MAGENLQIGQNQSRKTGIGIAGFVLGLLSIILLILSPTTALIIAILGFIFSLIQIRKDKTKLSVIGLILSIIGFIASIIMLTQLLIGFYLSSKSLTEWVKNPPPSPSLYGKEEMVVEGYVYDELNNPIKSASIKISCKSGLISFRSGDSTDKKGQFNLLISGIGGFPISEFLKKKGSCTLEASIANVSKSTQFNIEEHPPPISFVLPIKNKNIPISGG